MSADLETRVANLEEALRRTQLSLTDGLGAAAETVGVALHLLLMSGQYDTARVVAFFTEAASTATTEMERNFIQRLLSVLETPPTLH